MGNGQVRISKPVMRAWTTRPATPKLPAGAEVALTNSTQPEKQPLAPSVLAGTVSEVAPPGVSA